MNTCVSLASSCWTHRVRRRLRGPSYSQTRETGNDHNPTSRVDEENSLYHHLGQSERRSQRTDRRLVRHWDIPRTQIWGCRYEEIAAPYLHFTELGYEVVLSSVKGGEIPIDPGSLAEGFKTEAVDLFLKNGAMSVTNPNKLAFSRDGCCSTQVQSRSFRDVCWRFRCRLCSGRSGCDVRHAREFLCRQDPE